MKEVATKALPCFSQCKRHDWYCAITSHHLVRPAHTEMETTRKGVVLAKALRKRVSVTVAKFLQDCGKLLTDAEYSRVDDKSKADNDSAVDELIKILLTKDFDTVSSALTANGYEELVARLEEEAILRKSLNVAPSDQELPVKVEHVWNEPAEADNLPTHRFPKGMKEQSWNKGTWLVSLLNSLGLQRVRV